MIHRLRDAADSIVYGVMGTRRSAKSVTPTSSAGALLDFDTNRTFCVSPTRRFQTIAKLPASFEDVSGQRILLRPLRSGHGRQRLPRKSARRKAALVGRRDRHHLSAYPAAEWTRLETATRQAASVECWLIDSLTLNSFPFQGSARHCSVYGIMSISL